MSADDTVCIELNKLGYSSFKSHEQEAAVRSIVDGRDVFAALPTGAGKTLIFRLASRCIGGVAIVVSPLLSLITDQLVRAQQDNVEACTINGRTSKSARTAVQQRLLTSTEPSLLYVTAEMVNQGPFVDFMVELLAARRLSLFCIDEAHVCCVWAEHFRPAYGALARLRSIAPNVPLLMLTATASPSTEADICLLLGAKANVHSLRLPPRRPNLFIDVVKADKLKQPQANVVAFVVRVLEQHTTGVAIVYCRSKESCNYYAQRFKECKVAACLYHGDRSAAERAHMQKLWTDETVRVVVATVAFGLGIDKADVRCVVHVDLPSSLHSYAQEVGRAGRDGARAYCRVYLFATETASARGIIQQERKKLTVKLKTGGFSRGKLEDHLKSLQLGFKQVRDYAGNVVTCRHRQLDSHFGFSQSCDCLTDCDVCCERLPKHL